MDGNLEVRLSGTSGHGKARSDEPLHVGAATSVKIAITVRHPERVRCPGLTFDRHHVRVPGKHHTGVIRGTDRRPQIGFPAIGAVNQPAFDAKSLEHQPHIADEIEITVAADGWKGDKIAKNFDGTGHVVECHGRS